MNLKGPRQQILLVEDEINVGTTLVESLCLEGYETHWAKNLEEAKLVFSHRVPDLVLLDIGLPDGSGFDLVETIRRLSPSPALIFLTAYGSPEHRIKGLELGADDYLPKPFHFRELILRIRKAIERSHLLQQQSPSIPEPLPLGRAQLYLSRFLVRSEEKDCFLTHKETALLRLLLERANRPVSRDEILNAIWPEQDYPTPRTVDNFIVRLRKLIELNPDDPQIIRSVRGVGYQMMVSTEVQKK